MPTTAARQTVALLDVVDDGRRASWVDRALAIAALAGDDPAALRGQPVGRLQQRALDLHERLTGRSLDALATCPGCTSVVEFAVDAAMLLALGAAGPSVGEVREGDLVVTWRIPRVADLVEASSSTDAVGELRRRCLTAARHGRAISPDRIPPAVMVEAEAAMAQADPLAEVLVAVQCPQCGAAFEADLDPSGFVWEVLEARAAQTLREVDELARAYGWTEDVILGLAPARRAAYLEIVRGGRS